MARSVHALGRRVQVVGPTPAAHQQLSLLVMSRCFALHCILMCLCDPTLENMPRSPLTCQPPLLHQMWTHGQAHLACAAPDRSPKFFSGNFPASCSDPVLRTYREPAAFLQCCAATSPAQAFLQCDGATCPSAPLAVGPRHSRSFPLSQKFAFLSL